MAQADRRGSSRLLVFAFIGFRPHRHSNLQTASQYATFPVTCKMQVTIRRRHHVDHRHFTLVPAAIAYRLGRKSDRRLVLAAWFALVVALGANGVFVSAAGAPPLAIAIGAGLPIILFFAALRLSRAFRELVLTADL